MQVTCASEVEVCSEQEGTVPEMFFHRYFSQFIGVTSPKITKPSLPMRTKKGVQGIALGAIDATYLISAHKAQIVSFVELPDSAQVTWIASEKESAERYFLLQLIENPPEISPDSPILFGTISLAAPNTSFKLSYSPDRVHFCKKGDSFTFALPLVRAAYYAIKASPLSWDKEIKAAWRLHQSLIAGQELSVKEDEDLRKALKTTPSLIQLLEALIPIRVHSAEAQVLGWALRSKKAAGKGTVAAAA